LPGVGPGYDPAAKVSLLRAALMQHEPRFGVIVVGGHGDARQGVRLADGALFCGPGGLVDLSGLDLLLLVACAVGRVEQTGDCDVEGLYAHLAAHGCRSVIAAGWKIADREAAIFGAEVVRQYLESPTGPFRRARALNKARKTLLNTNNTRVSWHLASAFEIHGRG
jgi:CHAT domain-containing protein